MTKEQIKEKELQLREEKLKIAREKLEFKKGVWQVLKTMKLTNSQAKFIKNLVK